MIEQYFNCADSTVKEMISLFETRLEEPKEDKEKTSSISKKAKDKKFTNKHTPTPVL